MAREIRYLNHTIVIPDPAEPPQFEHEAPETSQKARGGYHDPAEYPPPEEVGPDPHHQHPDQYDSEMEHGGHGGPIMLIIDGKEVMVHLLPSGYFHTHELPFMRFSSIDDLAKAVVNYMEFGIYHGHAEESK